MKLKLIHRILTAGSAFAMIVLASACSDSSNPTDGGNNTPMVSLTWDGFVGPIFQNASSCASSNCHGGTPPPNNFSVASYALVVAGGNAGAGIVPNDTASSIAYQKLIGALGSQMPLGQAPLAPSTLDSIAMWIMAGAPESPTP